MKRSLFISLFLLLTSLEVQAEFETPNSDHELFILKQDLAALQERVDGLTTLIEGFNETISKLQKDKNRDENQSDTQMRMSVLEAKVGLLSKGQLKEINNDERFSDINITTKSVVDEKAEESIVVLPPSKLYSEGVRFFLKHKYSEAKERFLTTDTKNYKPAASNYYLGEISYYTKKYDDAIFYFKKSAGLYDQASYMDILLLHSAISLEKVGEADEAKLFYETIIESYPQKSSAKIARENIQKL